MGLLSVARRFFLLPSDRKLIIDLCFGYCLPGNMDHAKSPVLNTDLTLIRFSQQSAKCSLPVPGAFCLEPNSLAEIAGIVARTDQRTVNAGRRYFQRIALGDEVVGVKHIAQFPVDLRQVIKRDAAFSIEGNPYYPLSGF